MTRKRERKKTPRGVACPLREYNVQRPYSMTAIERKPSYFNSKRKSGWSKGSAFPSGIGMNGINRQYSVNRFPNKFNQHCCH